MKKTNLSWCASIHEKMHLFFDLIPVVNALVSRLAMSNFKKGKLYFKIHWKTNEEKAEKSEYNLLLKISVNADKTLVSGGRKKLKDCYYDF